MHILRNISIHNCQNIVRGNISDYRFKMEIDDYHHLAKYHKCTKHCFKITPNVPYSTLHMCLHLKKKYIFGIKDILVVMSRYVYLNNLFARIQ